MFSQVFCSRLAVRLVRKINIYERKFSSEPLILVKEVNNNSVVTLNRPKALNSLTAALNIELYKVLKELEQRRSLLILKGAGDRAFCSGGDLLKIKEAAETKNIQYLNEMTLYSHLNPYVILKYKIPVIVLMNGFTFGGGAGLSIFCKYRIATEKTKFAMPEAKIAFHPNVAGTFFLNRAPGRLGYYMALTGNSINGSDVLRAGFATHFCLSNKIDKIENELLNCSDEIDVKNVLENNCEKSFPEFSLGSTMDKINECFSGDTVEDIFYKLEQDGSTWAKETLEMMRKYSPSCLKVILRQLQIGKNMSVADCLVMESNLTVNFHNFPDAIEGTRVVLVDRQDSPQWNPSQLSDVTEELIQGHFKPAIGEKLRKFLNEIDNSLER
ncbi:3-hydroxyisobutyryl-CoA hydrolase, mitochondrial-like isoform X2 [Diorhabda sublineata]|uniref:3-hydroxyisobutyryl-CoA hydrolase, mitochondrial-like isoform X2 n=1 Tax=Diorhabda sublineata TaxID=1163346 RepID=UPI0024E066C6|nr:3-hydroxyisobutyryl-CoA hydrolase, mitochondrial-like isoform X2 [Diorhabda sublineata]